MKDTIFILEDRDNRSVVFNNISLDTGKPIKRYKFSSDAEKNFLRINPDVLFLDCTLSYGATKVEKETELHFIKWLVKNDKHILSRTIIIHTIDLDSIKEIKKLLPSAFFIPFNKFSIDRNILFSTNVLKKK